MPYNVPNLHRMVQLALMPLITAPTKIEHRDFGGESTPTEAGYEVPLLLKEVGVELKIHKTVFTY